MEASTLIDPEILLWAAQFLLVRLAHFQTPRYAPHMLPWFSNRFPLYLAPMAGITDTTFRPLCKGYGADVMVSKFVSAEGIIPQE